MSACVCEWLFVFVLQCIPERLLQRPPHPACSRQQVWKMDGWIIMRRGRLHCDRYTVESVISVIVHYHCRRLFQHTDCSNWGGQTSQPAGSDSERRHCWKYLALVHNWHWFGGTLSWILNECFTFSYVPWRKWPPQTIFRLLALLLTRQRYKKINKGPLHSHTHPFNFKLYIGLTFKRPLSTAWSLKSF